MLLLLYFHHYSEYGYKNDEQLNKTKSKGSEKMKSLKLKIFRNVVIALLAVIGINFLVLYSLNFPQMAIFQIKKYLLLLILLVAGFGIQIGLYTYLRHKEAVCTLTSMASGGVSSISMILCCSHYLINILQFISLSFATFLTKYTFYILLFGVASNIAGILFMLNKIKKINNVGV